MLVKMECGIDVLGQKYVEFEDSNKAFNRFTASNWKDLFILVAETIEIIEPRQLTVVYGASTEQIDIPPGAVRVGIILGDFGDGNHVIKSVKAKLIGADDED